MVEAMGLKIRRRDQLKWNGFCAELHKYLLMGSKVIRGTVTKTGR
jgi:hypothetical protein